MVRFALAFVAPTKKASPASLHGGGIVAASGSRGLRIGAHGELGRAGFRVLNLITFFFVGYAVAHASAAQVRSVFFTDVAFQASVQQ